MNIKKINLLGIFLSQLIFFYIIPYIVPSFLQKGGFFSDQYRNVFKENLIYIYPAFTSYSGAIYIFIIIPVMVYFFGKRYCSWICACGNLAETIGATRWGNSWVKKYTPRGKKAEKLEYLQYLFLLFSLVFGIVLFLDAIKILNAKNFLNSWKLIQDLIVDFIFGALIGVGAYPVLGTRIWCRFGCPLAGAMRLIGKWMKSKFKVLANNKCIGINLCTLQCPMGIPVSSFAHLNKKPLNKSFGLENTSCIGCGGCIDICPTGALSFDKLK